MAIMGSRPETLEGFRVPLAPRYSPKATSERRRFRGIGHAILGIAKLLLPLLLQLLLLQRGCCRYYMLLNMIILTIAVCTRICARGENRRVTPGGKRTTKRWEDGVGRGKGQDVLVVVVVM